MKKIFLLINIIFVLTACKDEELPEQGHTGAVINIQRLKEAPIVQSVHEIQSNPPIESHQNLDTMQSASIVQSSNDAPESPTKQISSKKQEMKNQ